MTDINVTTNDVTTNDVTNDVNEINSWEDLNVKMEAKEKAS